MRKFVSISGCFMHRLSDVKTNWWSTDEEARLAPGEDQTEDNEDEASPRVARSLSIQRCRGGEDGEGVVWHWTEVEHVRENSRPYTTFHWNEPES